MLEELVDFGNFNKKILVNPAVVLQILDLHYRNTNQGVQATLLGKVYSNAIQILEIVPVGLLASNEENSSSEQIKKLDYVQHSKSLQNLTTVYPNMQIIGVAVTDLQPNKNIAVLHTMYSHKDSGFKPQGILTNPIIVSVGTKIYKDSSNYELQSYCLNQKFLFCKDLMGVASFQRLQTTISFGDSDIESMAPLLEAVNDHDQFVPRGGVKELLKSLSQILKQLKVNCREEQEKVKVKRIIDRLRVEHNYSIQQLAYLMEYGSLQRRISSKISTLKD